MNHEEQKERLCSPILSLGITRAELEEVLRADDVAPDEYCDASSAASDDVLDGYSCGAGHSLAYISPFGDVYPCVSVDCQKSYLRTGVPSAAMLQGANLHSLVSAPLVQISGIQ